MLRALFIGSAAPVVFFGSCGSLGPSSPCRARAGRLAGPAEHLASGPSLRRLSRAGR